MSQKKGSNYENVAKARNKHRSSSTAGIAKGPSCQKTPYKRQYAKDSRFYRTDPIGYAAACKEVDRLHD